MVKWNMKVECMQFTFTLVCTHTSYTFLSHVHHQLLFCFVCLVVFLCYCKKEKARNNRNETTWNKIFSPVATSCRLYLLLLQFLVMLVFEQLKVDDDSLKSLVAVVYSLTLRRPQVLIPNLKCHQTHQKSRKRAYSK